MELLTTGNSEEQCLDEGGHHSVYILCSISIRMSRLDLHTDDSLSYADLSDVMFEPGSMLL